ncbi:hypothetical protein ACFQ60_06750 [Streptomyces zhihengii]
MDGTTPGGRPSRRTLLFGALGWAGPQPRSPCRWSWTAGAGLRPRGVGRRLLVEVTVPVRERLPSPSPSPSYERTSNALASAESGTMLSAGRFGKDGRFLAVGDRDGFVELRDSSTLEVLATLRNEASAAESGVGDLRFSPDGSLLAVVDDHAAVTLWDVASRKVAATLRGDSAQVETTVADCLAFSPDGRTLAYGADRTVVVWDVPSRRRIARMTDSADPEAEYKAEDYIGALAFGRDGRTLVHCNNLGKLRFWDLGRRRVTATVREPVDSITDLAVSPDGSLLAAATPEESASCARTPAGSPSGSPSAAGPPSPWSSVPTAGGWPPRRRAGGCRSGPPAAGKPSPPSSGPRTPRTAISGTPWRTAPSRRGSRSTRAVTGCWRRSTTTSSSGRSPLRHGPGGSRRPVPCRRLS